MLRPPEPCLRGGIREPGDLEPELDLCLGVIFVAVNILRYHKIPPDCVSPEGASLLVLLCHPLATVTVSPPGTANGLRALVDTKQLLPEDGLKVERGLCIIQR